MPQSDFQVAQKQAFEQFQVGLLDLDINHFLESCAPPVNLSKVTFVRTVLRMIALCYSAVLCMVLVTTMPLLRFFIFISRNTIAQVEARNQRKAEERERVLAEGVIQATALQLRHKFELDMAVLRSRIKGTDEVAKEAALDAKYLSQRQLILVFDSSLKSFDLGPF